MRLISRRFVKHLLALLLRLEKKPRKRLRHRCSGCSSATQQGPSSSLTNQNNNKKTMEVSFKQRTTDNNKSVGMRSQWVSHHLVMACTYCCLAVRIGSWLMVNLSILLFLLLFCFRWSSLRIKIFAVLSVTSIHLRKGPFQHTWCSTSLICPTPASCAASPALPARCWRPTN